MYLGKEIDILKSISGDFHPGELSAIMGGSGGLHHTYEKLLLNNIDLIII